MSVFGRPLLAAALAAVALSGNVSAGNPAVEPTPAVSTVNAVEVASVPSLAPQTPCAVAERPLRYVLDFDRGTTSAAATGEIAAACGSTTVYYPQIAVAVATSTDPAFAGRIGPGRAFSAQGERLAAQQANSSTTEPKQVVSRSQEGSADDAATPKADRSAEQWDMRAIGAPAARAINPGSRDVVVGVLDSGVDPNQPELARAIAPDLSAGCLTGAPDTAEQAWSQTTSPHGTHVAGIIAAAADNAGITGVAPGVRIASVKVIDDRGYVDPEAVVCGLMWAAKARMKVTNSSFFVNPWGLSCAHSGDDHVVHEVIARAVEYATSAGTLNVAAATNEAVNLTPSPGSGRPSTPQDGTGPGCEALPAGLRDVVAVSAVGANGVKAGYSSYGLGVIDVTAPGGDAGQCVLSTVPGGYAPLCGTSMAAPHAAGVVALLASAHPSFGPKQLRAALDNEAVPIACPADYDLTGDGTQDAYCAGYEGYNGFYGHGMVNATAAVLPARDPNLPSTGPTR
ncbi:MAG: in-like serine protease [Amycolatopsis sp.]|uniref:S8 family serine peptidase n=1 Tax=Amycolatopsis sp. TaxID=37632 RepID=UPI002611EF1C|nr:S8 family serine peptidase [Amycolatopsis sp.]MCU1681202.1 in-like serine protease [Amycolatopsis sp.]